MATQEDDLSGLAPIGQAASGTTAPRRSAPLEEDDDPFGTGNPNLADTRANLLAHGINPDLRIPTKRA